MQRYFCAVYDCGEKQILARAVGNQKEIIIIIKIIKKIIIIMIMIMIMIIIIILIILLLIIK